MAGLSEEYLRLLDAGRALGHGATLLFLKFFNRTVKCSDYLRVNIHALSGNGGKSVDWRPASRLGQQGRLSVTSMAMRTLSAQPQLTPSSNLKDYLTVTMSNASTNEKADIVNISFVSHFTVYRWQLNSSPCSRFFYIWIRVSYNCLNEAQGHTMKEMLKSSSAFLESDADEQLILNIIVRKLFGKEYIQANLNIASLSNLFCYFAFAQFIQKVRVKRYIVPHRCSSKG